MTKYAERIKEIEARKEVLRNEVENATVDRLKEIKEESEALSREYEEIRSKMDVATSLKENPIMVNQTVDAAEVRAKKFAESGAMEMRALLSTGTIAKPTEVGGINGLAETVATIVDDVTAVELTGNGAYVVAYQATDAAAAAVTDGSAIGGTQETYNYVTINPSEWGIHSEISNQVAKMTPLNYTAKVEQNALAALRAMAESKIIAAVKASALVETVKGATLDATYLRKLVLGFNAIPGKGEVKLYINRADLITLGNVRGTNEKRPLYEIKFDNGSTLHGTISEGGVSVPFSIQSGLTTGEQLFGQPKTVEMPMWDQYKIETNEGGEYFKKNLIGIRGIQTANADLCALHGMQLVKQSAS